MKRFMIINVTLALATVAAFAQSPRREGSTTRENRSAKTETTAARSSASSTNENRSGKSSATVTREKTNTNASTRNEKPNSEARTVRESRTSSTPENHPARSTTSTTTRQPANTTSHTREYRQPAQRGTTTTVNRQNQGTTRAYHSDARYVTPRSNVRTVHVNNSRPHHHHHQYETRTVIVKEPVRSHIVWDVNMHRDYREIYPYVRVWRIERGTPIYSIPAYNAFDYIGNVIRVYGIVREVYYDPATDDYHLYFGDYFPYQDFTAIVPGYVARQMSRRPYRYFRDQYMWVTGYISEFDGRPEILVKRAYQLDLY